MAKIEEPEMIAVRCKECRRIVAFKLAAGNGILQVKCPKCGNTVRIDLSLRKVKQPVYYRIAVAPLSVQSK